MATPGPHARTAGGNQRCGDGSTCRKRDRLPAARPASPLPGGCVETGSGDTAWPDRDCRRSGRILRVPASASACVRSGRSAAQRALGAISRVHPATRQVIVRATGLRGTARPGPAARKRRERPCALDYRCGDAAATVHQPRGAVCPVRHDADGAACASADDDVRAGADAATSANIFVLVVRRRNAPARGPGAAHDTRRTARFSVA